MAHQTAQGLMRVKSSTEFQLAPSHRGPCRPPNPSCSYFPGSGMQIQNIDIQQLAEYPSWFPDPCSEDYYGEKGQVEATRIASTRKIVNQEKYCIPVGIAEINATIKNLKDAGVASPTTSPFDSPLWPVQRTNRSWRTQLIMSLTRC